MNTRISDVARHGACPTCSAPVVITDVAGAFEMREEYRYAEAAPERGECGNCHEGKSDMDHVCPVCNGTAKQPAKPEAVRLRDELRDELRERAAFEDWYVQNAFDYASAPLGYISAVKMSCELPPGTKLYTAPPAQAVDLDQLRILQYKIEGWSKSEPHLQGWEAFHRCAIYLCGAIDQMIDSGKAVQS